MGGFCVTRPVDCCNAMESLLSEDKGQRKLARKLSLRREQQVSRLTLIMTLLEAFSQGNYQIIFLCPLIMQ